MELKSSLSALVIGGASLIGRALCIALAQKGIFVTVVDSSMVNGEEVASILQKENLKFHSGINFPSAIFVTCDFSNQGEVATAFEKHLEVYGGLDICINCAIDVDLLPVIDCTHRAVRIMEAAKKPGAMINLGSASGLHGGITDQIYSSNEGVFKLITDESKSGSCLHVTKNGVLEYSPALVEEAKYSVVSSRLTKKSSTIFTSAVEIPKSFEQMIVHTLSKDFRMATSIVRAPLKLPIKPGHVLLKVIYAGVNASDIGFSYHGFLCGTTAEIRSKLPFYPGIEAVGIIAAVGYGIKNLIVGTPAVASFIGLYAEFTMVPVKHILPVERPNPEVLAMVVSGVTASIALEKVAAMESGKTVLVSAAAGANGQFAVQLAKLAGNKVIATCGGNDKAKLLMDLGVDRVINYKEESIENVLKKEFPKGLDIVYENVGGHMFDLCFNALADCGRIVVIGQTSQFKEDNECEPRNHPGLCRTLLKGSKTVLGFNLLHYKHLWPQHLDKLVNLFSMGKLKVTVEHKRFVGLQSVPDAVEYIHSGKSMGKVVVCIDPSFSQDAGN